MPTVLSPGGPVPRRADADIRGLNENVNVAVASNHMGGVDLLMLRYTFIVMTQGAVNVNGKRAVSKEGNSLVLRILNRSASAIR